MAKNKLTHFIRSLSQFWNKWDTQDVKQHKDNVYLPQMFLPLQVGDLQRPQSVFVREASERLGLHLLLPSTVKQLNQPPRHPTSTRNL